jgi:ketosteroid isomerase-like protein
MIEGMGKPSRTFSVAVLGLLSLGLCARAQQAPEPAAKPGTVSPAFREMQAVEDRWSDAITKRDQYGMELVLAPQFIGISASGDVTTRNQQIANLFLKGSGPASLEQKVISVRFVGEVAIVNGTYVMTFKTEKGPFQEKGIFSHVFEHVHNNWLCLNSQRTVVAEDVKRAVQEKPKSTKRSDAELPMHIPLVYKGPESTQPAPLPGSGTPPP